MAIAASLTSVHEYLLKDYQEPYECQLKLCKWTPCINCLSPLSLCDFLKNMFAHGKLVHRGATSWRNAHVPTMKCWDAEVPWAGHCTSPCEALSMFGAHIRAWGKCVEPLRSSKKAISLWYRFQILHRSHASPDGFCIPGHAFQRWRRSGSQSCSIQMIRLKKSKRSWKASLTIVIFLKQKIAVPFCWGSLVYQQVPWRPDFLSLPWSSLHTASAERSRISFWTASLVYFALHSCVSVFEGHIFLFPTKSLRKCFCWATPQILSGLSWQCSEWRLARVHLEQCMCIYGSFLYSFTCPY